MIMGISLFYTNAFAQTSEKYWTLPEKKIPAGPQDGTDELRNYLIGIQQPDVEAARSISPKSDEEWNKAVETKTIPRALAMDKMARDHSVTITEDTIEGVRVYNMKPDEINPKHKKHLFIYLHGGAYVFNPGRAGLGEAILIAARDEIQVLSVDYRMPPLYPFPAELDDVVTVYKAVLKDYRARSLALGGISAGSRLTLATVHKLKELGVDLPGVIYAGTPWADLTKTGDSYFINEGIDHLLVTNGGAGKRCQTVCRSS